MPSATAEGATGRGEPGASVLRLTLSGLLRLRAAGAPGDPPQEGRSMRGGGTKRGAGTGGAGTREGCCGNATAFEALPC
eukprot:236720-Chlamydomonas_euryale.AAC.1